MGDAMMGFNDLDESMANSAEETIPSDANMEDHGLRFINDEWNGSIANGQTFNLRWNDSIGEGGGDLSLFKIWYPENGVMEFELVSNLTEDMDGGSFDWTPDNLTSSDLYALWVSRNGAEQQWAISPPWKVEEGEQGFHWTNPIGIPIVVILGVYFTSLAACLLYRRQRHKKRDQQRRPPLIISAPISCNDRHPSLSSVVTAKPRRREMPSESPGWTSPTSTVRESDQTSPTGAFAYTSPLRGVRWNDLDWRREEHSETGGERIFTREERFWRHDRDEGSIGIAH